MPSCLPAILGGKRQHFGNNILSSQTLMCSEICRPISVSSIWEEYQQALSIESEVQGSNSGSDCGSHHLWTWERWRSLMREQRSLHCGCCIVPCTWQEPAPVLCVFSGALPLTYLLEPAFACCSLQPVTSRCMGMEASSPGPGRSNSEGHLIL